MSEPRTSPSGARATAKAVAKGLVFLLTMAGAVALLRMAGLEHVLDEAWIDAEIRGRGWPGWLLFTGMTGLFTAIGLPRQIPAFLGGYAFGIVFGTFLALVGTGLGCAASFLYARHMGRELVQSRFARRFSRIDAFLTRDTFQMAVLIRFMPLGNNLLTNLVAGVSRARFWSFLAGSVLGYLPQTLIFALAGSGVRVDPGLRLTLAATLLAASTWLGYRIYRKYRKKRKTPPEPAGKDD